MEKIKKLTYSAVENTSGQNVFSLLSAEDKKFNFLRGKANKTLIVANIVMAIVYFTFILFFVPKGFGPLFYLLIAGEIFHIWQILTYSHTVWDLNYEAPKDCNFLPPVEVYITVAGESPEIVEQTSRAVMRMDYPSFNISLLNDGFVAGKENWKDIVELAKKLDIGCITRQIPGGAKAGNINNALKTAEAPFIAVFDADQAPHSNFLKTLMPFFVDPKIAFIQSPQFYKNYGLNEVTGGSWEQQEIFFGPVCRGKNKTNSAFMCGTNMVIRTEALRQAGGMDENNIAEDFLTSMLIHKQGWKSLYVPEVLAEGLAAEDFLSYYKQQLRWAKGSLELLFKNNPLLQSGLSFSQKVQYLSSACFYLSGLVILLDALLPIVYFFTGQVPLALSGMTLAALFLPYIFLTVSLLKMTTNYSLTFRAVAFSMSAWPIHVQAFFNTIIGKKNNFDITSKKGLSGNFLYLTAPHIAYICLTLAGVWVAIGREGLSAAFLNNLAWAMFNCIIFLVFISASFPEKKQIAVAEELILVPVEVNTASIQNTEF